MNMHRSSCMFLVSKDGSSILNKSYNLNNKKKLYNMFLWCCINAALLIFFMVDIVQTCGRYNSYYNYLEYALATICALNVVYYIYQLLTLSQKEYQMESENLVTVTHPKSDMSSVTKLSTSSFQQSSGDSSAWHCASTPSSSFSYHSKYNWLSTTPHNYNTSISSVHNSPRNYDVMSSSKNRDSLPSSLSNSATFKDFTSKFDYISDDSDLEKYLKSFETSTAGQQFENQLHDSSTNLLSSFWSHPNARTVKDTSALLKNHRYQLSPHSHSQLKTSGLSSKLDDSTESITHHIWNHFNVNFVTLTQWNANLRKWISQTILERIVSEMDSINSTLEQHGFNDMKLGSVGLDRLKKQSKMPHLIQCCPSLPTLVPFLDITTNQEYLERRLRDLANGGSISAFKWNTGGTYGGKKWDTSLPSDTMLIMHLIATYLDTKLNTYPNTPDIKTFSGYHYIKYKEKIPKLNEDSILIQQTSEHPPHFRLFIGELIYDCSKGYNNLFHTMLLFLYLVNEKHYGLFGQNYLGKSDLNMLWIIDQ